MKSQTIQINMESIAVFTPDQLREFAAAVVRETLAATNETTTDPDSANTTQRRYVYGLRGIRELFGVCHATAQRYKDTFLRPAIIQRGKKIQIDADRAIELFNEHKNV